MDSPEQVEADPRLLGGVAAVVLFLLGAAIMQVGLQKQMPALALTGALFSVGAGVAFILRRKKLAIQLPELASRIPRGQVVLLAAWLVLFLILFSVAHSSPTPNMVYAVRTCLVSFVAFAFIAAVAYRGNCRAFWAGLAIVACAHEHLVSESIQLVAMLPWQFAGRMGGMRIPGLGMSAMAGSDPVRFLLFSWLKTVLFGLAGGCLCVFLHARRCKDELKKANDSVSL